MVVVQVLQEPVVQVVPPERQDLLALQEHQEQVEPLEQVELPGPQEPVVQVVHPERQDLLALQEPQEPQGLLERVEQVELPDPPEQAVLLDLPERLEHQDPQEQAEPLDRLELLEPLDFQEQVEPRVKMVFPPVKYIISTRAKIQELLDIKYCLLIHPEQLSKPLLPLYLEMHQVYSFLIT